LPVGIRLKAKASTSSSYVAFMGVELAFRDMLSPIV
jgi:hypothetical protein